MLPLCQNELLRPIQLSNFIPIDLPREGGGGGVLGGGTWGWGGGRDMGMGGGRL